MAKTTEVDELVEMLPKSTSPLSEWDPKLGTEAQQVLEQVPAESKATVQSEALSILRRCVPPTADEGWRTGLVIGYIQSGKTLSFTTVSALARDNDYQLVIVITGTTTDLFDQSNKRLTRDLRLDQSRRWKRYRSDKLHKGAVNGVRSAIERWSNANTPESRRQTVLLTVMKEGSHLDKTISLLRDINLDGVPTLVIDDEADQAGLNTKVDKGKQSATYARLLRLRRQLPHHTYLQYTATPQALLLLNLIDTLAPDFAEVLTPGEDYTGGSEFFEKEDGLVRTIPESHLPRKDSPLKEPPVSYLEALRQYFVGAASTELNDVDDNRSAMVHPSRLTKIHAKYDRWTRAILARWQAELESDPGSRDYQECRVAFRKAYDDLSETFDEMADFDAVLDLLPLILQEVVVLQMNRRPPSKGGTRLSSPMWNQERYHILIGGQKLNRGFTVEGLTVSYMPRGPGVGNADTIQQRARWFGYKADYLGLCRVYLPIETRQAYQNLVEHEENVRSQVHELQEKGVPLRDWKRHFVLDSSLRPTRSSVIQNEVIKGKISEWYYPRVPHEQTALEENRAVLRSFLDSIAWRWDEGHADRTDAQRHHLAEEIALKEVLEDLLTELEVRHPNDAIEYTGLLLQLSYFLDRQADATVRIYEMRPKVEATRRGLDEAGRLKNLFQGANPKGSGHIYPGDRAIRAGPDDPESVTVQVHWLHEVRASNSKRVKERDVPVVAVYLPEEAQSGWVIAEDSSAVQ